MSRWTAVLFVLGCGGSASTRPASSTPPMQPVLVDPAPEPQKLVACKPAVEHVVTTMAGSRVDQMITLYVQRCEQDVWTDAARACMANAASQKEGERCFADHLSNAQRKSLGDATLAAFGNSKP